jgi:hypothetical protein
MSARGNRIRRIIVWGTLAATCALAWPGKASADVGFRVGYLFDSEAVSVGMEMLTPLNGVDGEWYFNPNVELAAGDRRDLLLLNADFHYDFATQSNTAVWVGAGPALLLVDRDVRFDDDDTDVDPALNMLVGLGAKTGSYRPFVQMKGILSDNSEAALSVGVRF